MKPALKEVTAPQPIQVLFAFERETKGAVRYQECDSNKNPKDIAAGAVVGTLYLRKSALGEIPMSLTLQIIPD